MDIQLATLKDIAKLAPALLELRPHLTIQALEKMLPLQFEEGYKIIYVGNNEMAFAVAGYRTINFLYSGKTLYIDDLVTHPAHKRKGYAGELLNWLKKYARENGYDHFSLDSGFQRKDAHRLYLNAGLELESFHFGRKMANLQ